MSNLAKREWLPAHCEKLIQEVSASVSKMTADEIASRLEQLIAENQQIHDHQCINLNPATNIMNPAAEALLASGLGTRASLGYPGDKYEMGLEAIEQIEAICGELCAEVFDARFAEIRVGSGALANLYGFMALTRAGDDIIVPPAIIGGHVTHHSTGAAGLYGLNIHHAPVDRNRYTVDLDALQDMVNRIQPRLITIGGSLNLVPHPVREIRKIADTVGAKVLFDAAHQCGMIAGRRWDNPLRDGAHLMTMSTYKSLGGPAGGLVVTNDAELAQKLETIAFPGLTANFDVAKSAALAVTMLDWLVYGQAYATAMVDTAQALAEALDAEGAPVFATSSGFTTSHQFALQAEPYGGGQTAAKKLRAANLLSCGIGLPLPPVTGDMNGLRFGTPEIVRRGMLPTDMQELASLVMRALLTDDPKTLATATTDFRSRFQGLAFIRQVAE